MTNDTPVHAEDVIPVRSRINWGAIVAGAALALALYLLLTLLGTAIGLSIDDKVSDRSLGIGAVVWAILVTAGCLFLGGFVASQLTTGENKIEGTLYGVLVWAIFFAVLMTMVARAVGTGFSAMIGMANTANATSANTGMTWEDAARRAGYTDEQIGQARETLGNAPANARDAANNPLNRQRIEDNATKAAWYTFLGTLVSMLAAAIGGFVGAGPTLRLFTVRVDRTAAGAFDRRDTFVRT